MIGESDEYLRPGWMVGGYMDDSLTDDQVARIAAALGDSGGATDAVRFTEWLRGELADYRNLMDISGGLPGISDDRVEATRLQAKVSALLRDLDRVSPNLASRVDAELLESGHAPQAVIGALTALNFSLLSVQIQLTDMPPPKRGRKSNTLRDQLLRKVTQQLLAAQAPKSKAPILAAEVLTICGVPTPHDGRFRPEKRRGKN